MFWHECSHEWLGASTRGRTLDGERQVASGALQSRTLDGERQVASGAVQSRGAMSSPPRTGSRYPEGTFLARIEELLPTLAMVLQMTLTRYGVGDVTSLTTSQAKDFEAEAKALAAGIPDGVVPPDVIAYELRIRREQTCVFDPDEEARAAAELRPASAEDYLPVSDECLVDALSHGVAAQSISDDQQLIEQMTSTIYDQRSVQQQFYGKIESPAKDDSGVKAMALEAHLVASQLEGEEARAMREKSIELFVSYVLPFKSLTGNDGKAEIAKAVAKVVATFKVLKEEEAAEMLMLLRHPREDKLRPSDMEVALFYNNFLETHGF